MDKKEEKGFTLIELMLALAIVGIVVSLSTGFMVDIFRIVIPSSERMNTKQIAEIRLNEISKYARSASEIDTTNDTITVNGAIIVEYDGSNEILINNEDGTFNRSISNIKNYDINKVDDLYEITIEVCRDNDCDKAETVSTKITPRNITP
ncbi:MAG: PulJ/GspJ family protein [Halanaerobiales bacterium]